MDTQKRFVFARSLLSIMTSSWHYQLFTLNHSWPYGLKYDQVYPEPYGLLVAFLWRHLLCPCFTYALVPESLGPRLFVFFRKKHLKVQQVSFIFIRLEGS